MVTKSVSRTTVVLLLLTLAIFSLACDFSPIAPLIILDNFFGTNFVSRAYQSPPEQPAATEAAAATEVVLPVTEGPVESGSQATEAAAPLSATEAPAAQPVSPGTNATVIGGWCGPYCDEAEGTFYYRWSVDLMQNPADGSYAGTVKFHNCPGGGRLLYRVTGAQQAGPLITLTGVMQQGGGALHDNAAALLEFTFDLSTGQISPNLAP